MDGHTAALARACVEMGLVGELSSARLRDELVLLLGEQDVRESISRLEELGLAHAVHPHLSTDRESVELLERIDALEGAPRPGRATLASAPRGARAQAAPPRSSTSGSAV